MDVLPGYAKSVFSKTSMRAFLLTVSLLVLGGQPAWANNDPLEGFNRKVFAFNEFVDKYFMKPVARVYDRVTPDFIDDSISNVYDNLDDLGNALNSLLQGKVKDSASDLGRVLVNTTVGVAGLVDVATRMGMDKHEEDFGQTFARWKIGQGPYIVLPFFGPSTLRDAFGRIPDAYTLPQRYIDHVPTRNSVYGVDIVDTRSDLLQVEELVQGDRYTFIRDIYLQRRDFLIGDGEVEDEFTADDFEDEDE